MLKISGGTGQDLFSLPENNFLGLVFKNHAKTDIRVLSPLLADRYYWFLNTVS